MKAGVPLQAWISLDGLVSSPVNGSNQTALDFVKSTTELVSPCKAGGQVVNCTDVCSNTTLLFDEKTPENLITCGSWAELQAYYTNTDSFGAEAFERYKPLGLDEDDSAFADNVRDGLTTCFQSFSTIYHAGATTNYEQNSDCDFQSPFLTINLINGSTVQEGFARIGKCVSDMCEPFTFDPDVFGIGVFISFIIQSSISVLSYIALMVSGPRREGPDKSIKTAPRQRQKEILLASLLDFHKTQCFFNLSVQIASLISLQTLLTSESLSVLNIAIFPGLAVFTLVPLIFTFACVGRYGVITWYITVLTIMSFIVSVATRISFLSLADFDRYYGKFGNFTTLDGCDGSLTNSVSTWCPENVSDEFDRLQAPTAFWNSATPYIYTMSAIWILYTLIKQIRKPGAVPFGIRRRASAIIQRIPLYALVVRTLRRPAVRKAWSVFFFLTSMMAFAYQLRYFGVIFAVGIVSREWAFGQVVAMLIWLPAIVEYAYLFINGIERGFQYRLQPPLKVTAEDLDLLLSAWNEQQQKNGVHDPNHHDYGLGTAPPAPDGEGRIPGKGSTDTEMGLLGPYDPQQQQRHRHQHRDFGGGVVVDEEESSDLPSSFSAYNRLR